MAANKFLSLSIGPGDALIVVDVQNDFLSGGSLVALKGDEVVAVLNHHTATFSTRDLPVFATRDWHPPDRCSFRQQGGPRPSHCVAGAEFAPGLKLPASMHVVSKATTRNKDAYSDIEDSDLDAQQRAASVRRAFIGGLTTDYCVLNTVIDSLALGYETFLLEDAVRAVEFSAGDGAKTLAQMHKHSARPMTREVIGA